MASFFSGGSKPAPLSSFSDDDLMRPVSMPVAKPVQVAPVAPAQQPAGISVPQAESLDKHLASIASRVRSAKRKAAAAILAIGKELVEAQRLLAAPNSGSFTKFVKEQCKLSSSTAYRAIDAFNRFGDDADIARAFEPAALYKLSKAPDAAVDEARAMIAQGDTITCNVASMILRNHSPKKTKASKPAPIIFQTPSGQVVVHLAHEHASVSAILAHALREVQGRAA